MFNNSKPVELNFIFAVGQYGQAIVMKADSEFLELEVSEIGPMLDDLGVEYDETKPGIYAWSGTVHFTPNGSWECPNEGFDVEYKANSIEPVNWLTDGANETVLKVIKGR